MDWKYLEEMSFEHDHDLVMAELCGIPRVFIVVADNSRVFLRHRCSF